MAPPPPQKLRVHHHTQRRGWMDELKNSLSQQMALLCTVNKSLPLTQYYDYLFISIRHLSICLSLFIYPSTIHMWTHGIPLKEICLKHSFRKYVYTPLLDTNLLCLFYAKWIAPDSWAGDYETIMLCSDDGTCACSSWYFYWATISSHPSTSAHTIHYMYSNSILMASKFVAKVASNLSFAWTQTTFQLLPAINPISGVYLLSCSS